MNKLTVSVTIKKRPETNDMRHRNFAANCGVSANPVPRIVHQVADLPKSPLLTRSVSVILNQRVTKDTYLDDDNDCDEDLYHAANSFKIVGRKMTPRAPVGENCPNWSKLLTHRRSNGRRIGNTVSASQDEKRSRREYLGLKYEEQKQPYSWNYSLRPVKVLDAQNRSDVRTARGLSEALRTYAVTTQSRKLTDDNLDNRRVTKTSSTAMSPWTREWLQQSQRSLMRDTGTPLFPPIRYTDRAAESDALILEHARTKLVLAQKPKNGRVPANTPLPQTK